MIKLDDIQHVTGKPPFTCLLDNPAHNNVGQLELFASQALWAGCLDATDHLLSGSCRNSNYQGQLFIYSSFNLRPL